MPAKIINKPWGEEIILTETSLPYCAKIIKVKRGKRWSLQYHDQKTETITLIEGSARIITGQKTGDLKTELMKPEFGYTIMPLIIHRIEAETDCIILEASTPETGTTFRLQDDFIRPNETESIRNLHNRGWK